MHLKLAVAPPALFKFTEGAKASSMSFCVRSQRAYEVFLGSNIVMRCCLYIWFTTHSVSEFEVFISRSTIVPVVICVRLGTPLILRALSRCDVDHFMPKHIFVDLSPELCRKFLQESAVR